jgi:mRNA interferase RelE/StbE
LIYKIKYSKKVIKFLQKTQKNIARKVVETFEDLKNGTQNLSKYDIKYLEGFENKYRLRVGKYRIIFSMNDNELIIEVIDAASRGDIYK